MSTAVGSKRWRQTFGRAKAGRCYTHNLPVEQSLFSAPYTVRVHEHVDAEFAKVTLKCLGYPTKGVQPTEWAFVLLVPTENLIDWPLGLSVRLAVV